MDFLTQNEKGDLNSISKGTKIPRSTTHRLLYLLMRVSNGELPDVPCV
ncbi:helix-turn-helix domain-containing protein [Calidifontibacillus erzurumensis]